MAFYDISKVIDGGSMEKKKYIIGLDLGINNVGYSVVDEETKKILKKGVRLFSQANEAEDRRIARNTRRRLKRRENRVNETLKLFESIGFPNELTIDTELLYNRVRGLKEKLDSQEIVNIICYFMMHRGYIPFGDEERNLVDLNGLLPCEYYMYKWQEIGKYRALEEVVNHKDLKLEMKTLLENQRKFYPELSQIIGDEESGLFWIFSRKRKFWEGPGSIYSFTEYGRFKNNLDVAEYQLLKKYGKEKYLFEDLIGHCKIYVNEKCAPLPAGSNIIVISESTTPCDSNFAYSVISSIDTSLLIFSTQLYVCCHPISFNFFA